MANPPLHPETLRSLVAETLSSAAVAPWESEGSRILANLAPELKVAVTNARPALPLVREVLSAISMPNADAGYPVWLTEERGKVLLRKIRDIDRIYTEGPIADDMVHWKGVRHAIRLVGGIALARDLYELRQTSSTRATPQLAVLQAAVREYGAEIAAFYPGKRQIMLADILGVSGAPREVVEREWVRLVEAAGGRMIGGVPAFRPHPAAVEKGSPQIAAVAGWMLGHLAALEILARSKDVPLEPLVGGQESPLLFVEEVPAAGARGVPLTVLTLVQATGPDASAGTSGRIASGVATVVASAIGRRADAEAEAISWSGLAAVRIRARVSPRATADDLTHWVQSITSAAHQLLQTDPAPAAPRGRPAQRSL